MFRKVLGIIAATISVMSFANISVIAEDAKEAEPIKPRKGCVYYVYAEIQSEPIYWPNPVNPVDPGFNIGGDRKIHEQHVRVVCPEDEPIEEKPAAYDPCAVGNPALAGRGCIFFLEDKGVVANGDGNITTTSGNIYDPDGNFVGTDVEFAKESGLIVE